MRKTPVQRPLTCAVCPNPLKQSRSGRIKHFCSPKCRKKANRIATKYQHETAKANLLRQLRKQWEIFDKPTTVFTLEQIVKIYGVGAAGLATDALMQELKARVETPFIEAQFRRSVLHQIEIDEHVSRSAQ